MAKNNDPPKNLLAEALADIKKELYALGIEKKSLEGSLKSLKETIESTKADEEMLKKQIFRLIEKETALSGKKLVFEKKLAGIDVELVKVGKLGKKMEATEG